VSTPRRLSRYFQIQFPNFEDEVLRCVPRRVVYKL
jgi:hypothetical protein